MEENSCTVNIRNSFPPGKEPLHPSPEDPTLDGALRDLNARWREGRQARAEDILACYPEIRTNREAVLQLICEELSLREEAGQKVEFPELVERFPEYQGELRVLGDCYQFLQEGGSPRPQEDHQPPPGFQILVELGRGVEGRVFLATQTALANRPVVLKIGRRSGQEHLSLARLQHTHIVPLYSVYDSPRQNVRTLCMPYFGGATLKHLQEKLQEIPLTRRRGGDLLSALDQVDCQRLVPLPTEGRARPFLERSSYVEAVCWIGACLAEALQYAHDRGLMHLDIKPSNVLLAVDGQPMLLDFHLAQGPLRPGEDKKRWLGGTPGYMSPEQHQAFREILEDRPITVTVDGGSDVYSLGVLLYELLSGERPTPAGSHPPLGDRNPQVSRGLADVIQKCLAPAKEERYTAGDLAQDLHRHLDNLPLKGVPNHDPVERWRKWRRRRPFALPLILLALTLMAAVGAGVYQFFTYVGERRHNAQAFLNKGKDHLRFRRYAEAVRDFSAGLEQARGLPGEGSLARALASQLELARRAKKGQDLYLAAETARLVFLTSSSPKKALHVYLTTLSQVWEERETLLREAGPDFEGGPDLNTSRDLVDLALCLADLHVRLASPAEKGGARAVARQILGEAERLTGPNPALSYERLVLAGPGEELASSSPGGGKPPQGSWDHFTLGRSLLRAGKYSEARAHLQRGLAGQPHAFWPNFCLGVCDERLGNQEEAVRAFSVCIGQAPANSQCFFLRARALAASGDLARAMDDLDHALLIQEKPERVGLDRPPAFAEGNQAEEELADQVEAKYLSNDPLKILFHLSRMSLYREDFEAARGWVEQHLRQNPGHPRALNLLDRIQKLTPKD